MSNLTMQALHDHMRENGDPESAYCDDEPRELPEYGCCLPPGEPAVVEVPV